MTDQTSQNKLIEIQSLTPPVDTRAITAFVNDLTITNDSMYQIAGTYAIQLKGKQQAVSNFFKPMREPAQTAKIAALRVWQAIVAREELCIAPIKDLEKSLDQKMLDYVKRKKAEAAAAEARLRAQAQAEVEKTQAALLVEASKAEKPIDVDMYVLAADEVKPQEIQIAPVVPKLAGAHVRKTWKAEVMDARAFIAEALKNPDFLKYIRIDTTSMLRDNWRECAGINFHQEESIVKRAPDLSGMYF